MAAEAAAAAAVATGTAGPSALVDFIAGTAGGIASLLAGHPFDTVKTRLQAQPSVAPSLPHTGTGAPTDASSISSRTKLSSSSTLHYSAVPAPSSSRLNSASATLTMPSPAVGSVRLSLPVYRSATEAFRLIIAQERLSGLYKGVTSPMLGVAIMNASIFGLYNISLRYQTSHHLFDGYPITQVFIAGMLSGLGSSLITAPIDLIKIREQMNTTAGAKRPGTWTVFKDVLRKEGLFRGVYRGWCTTAVRDLGYGPYFASYELLNAQIKGYTGKPLTNLDMAVSGAVAGVVAWVSTFWADVIKTKIQATSVLDDARSGRRGGSLFWSTARQTFAEGGWRAFFVGVGPTVLRALPVNAVLFVTYEATKDFLITRGY